MAALRPRFGAIVIAACGVALVAVLRERAFARSQAEFDRIYGSG